MAEKKEIPQCVLDAIETMLAPYGAHLADITNQTRRYMTAKQAAIYSGLSPKNVRDRALDGEFESIRISKSIKGRILIDFYSFNQWLNSFKNHPPINPEALTHV